MIIKRLRKILSKLKAREVRIERVMAVPPFENMLDGKGALVIGGSQGIGREIAIRLSQAGAKVIVTGRNEEKLRVLKEQSAVFDYITMDISRIEEQADLMEAAVKKSGG